MPDTALRLPVDPAELPQERHVIAQQPGEAVPEAPHRKMELATEIIDKATGMSGWKNAVAQGTAVAVTLTLLSFLVYHMTETIPARMEKSTERIETVIEKAIVAAQNDSNKNREAFQTTLEKQEARADKFLDRSDATNKRMIERHKDDTKSIVDALGDIKVLLRNK